MLGILRGKPARRLVEKEDVRRADHVEADVQALALAAAQGLCAGASHHEIPALVEPEFGELAVDPAEAFPPREVGGADRRREIQVFLDREVLVKRVVLGDVGDVFPQRVVVGVERAVVEEDIALVRRKLPGERAHERALPAPARPHHAHHLAALDGKSGPVNGDGAVRKPADEIAHLDRADDVAFLLDQALGEIAAQDLADIHADRVPVGQRRGIPHRDPAHEDRAVGLQHLQAAFPPVVVAGDFQEDIPSGAGGEEDVVFLEEARVVGN